jgi:hypothetical protein
MDTLVSYLISIGIIAFGVWIVVVAAKAASGSVLVWVVLGLLPIAVGTFSLLSEMRSHKAEV